jgi:hypothetical protein
VLTKREFRQIVRSDNTSGALGVIFVKSKNSPQGAWQARMRLPDGKLLTRGFSVRRYGEREAFDRAVAARKEFLRLIADSPYLHSPKEAGRHGEGSKKIGKRPAEAIRSPGHYAEGGSLRIDG